jgi:hypothetical protein
MQNGISRLIYHYKKRDSPELTKVQSILIIPFHDAPGLCAKITGRLLLTTIFSIVRVLKILQL